MTATRDEAVRAPRRTRTIWGCTPEQVHDRFWASFGVQVVRRGERFEEVEGAELYLLCERGTLVLFSPEQVIDTLFWVKPDLLVLRVRDCRPQAYREVAVTDGGRLMRFAREYRGRSSRRTRVALTADREIARSWQRSGDEDVPWRSLRASVTPDGCIVRTVQAHLYDEADGGEVMECMHEILGRWRRPGTTIRRAARHVEGTWIDPTADVPAGARLEGPVWVGAGRRVEPDAFVLGPAVLWDDPAQQPAHEAVRWVDIEPSLAEGPAARPIHPSAVPGKRAFDIAFSLLVLTLALPFLPLVAIAILLEDGWPVFYVHRRETVGGVEFGCLKFRSMRRRAPVSRQDLAGANRADGPQFFIPDDPRVTRVGRFLRRFQIDEIPQFVNVLLGHMSVVGPRPSPFSENQYCPAWREARLSVRPGVTGLWQVRRTRRPGLDFQEWIRFDLDYVERASWSLDLEILWRTAKVVFAGIR